MGGYMSGQAINSRSVLKLGENDVNIWIKLKQT